eukprot:gb/GECH01002201.1/.p1 GENE.gb/GECH01002201.1/~~gb/GECH01002201.1/.p1  ORF type:complete len:144 (+),score=27.76 gb/GECH01002201.1/:1-432(+)
MLGVEVDDWIKIGFGLTAFGMFFIFLGVILLFDAGFIALGNLLFLSGVPMAIGLRSTFNFFFQKQKWKGTTLFFIGIIIVLINWPIIGLILESFGFVNLFGDFFPIAIRFARQLPIIGNILNAYPIGTLLDRFMDSGEESLPL